MFPLIRIATDLYPKNRIESVNLDATFDGAPGIEVKLKGEPDSFRYWGEYAKLALAALVPAVVLRIGADTIPVDNIGWVNLNANFNGQQGVEIRVDTDEPGKTRQYTGEFASTAYDQVTQLAVAEDTTGAAA